MSDIFHKFPEISLKKSILREIKITDVKDFYKYITDKNIAKYVPDDEVPSDISNAEGELAYWINLFKYKTSIYWAIADKETGKMIGSCGFHYWNKQQGRLEISYDLSYKFWGKGIAIESVASVTDFAFKNMNARRIQATVAIDNERSIRLLESCKYAREGILESYFNLRGKIKNAYMYARVLTTKRQSQ